MLRFPLMARHLAPLLVAGVLLANVAAWAEQALVFPGTGWTITPPDGFVMVDQPIRMLRNPAGALILVAQFPPSPFTDDGARAGDEMGSGNDRGRIEVIEHFDEPGRSGVYMEARLLERGALSLGMHLTTATSTVLANALVPDAAVAGTDMAALRRSLRSLQETAVSLQDRIDGFPLAVADPPGMRLVSVVGEASVLWTDGPADRAEDSATQRFLSLAVVKLPPDKAATTLGRGADFAIAQALRARYPGLRILDSSLESHAGGMHVFGQYPVDDAATFGSFRTLFRDLALRPQP
jgi:hypothetical protein